MIAVMESAMKPTLQSFGYGGELLAITAIACDLVMPMTTMAVILIYIQRVMTSSNC